MNILITSAGRRVSLVKEFKNELTKVFPHGKVFTADNKPEIAPACRVSDGYFPVVKVTDKDYSIMLMDICKKNNINIVIPTIDTELIPLAENIDLFTDNNINLVVSSLKMVKICRNKNLLFDYFDSIGFPRTEKIDLEHPEFPVFMKPVDGSSSIGSMIIHDQHELSFRIKSGSNNIFQKYLSPDDYKEYTIDMYYDKNKKLKCAVPRERLEIRGGEVSKAITRRDYVYDFIISSMSACDEFRGCITLQIFKHIWTNRILGIEINPRFGGGYPLSYHAGANYPGFIIREYLLNKDIPFFDEWKKDILMLRYDDEIIVNDYKS
jgi:carbamoyl-phosphate synthase large subunit